jgi:hypothetical protein
MLGLVGGSGERCQCAGGAPYALHGTAGCSGTQQCRTYVHAQIIDALHLMMFFHLGNQMSSLHPLMKFPLHRDGMVQLMEVATHSYHAANEEDTPTGSEPDSCDPSTHHS